MLPRIEANTFIGAPQLKSIKLLYNNLQVFDRYALNGTENRLRNIYLSRNSLRVIENGTFQLVPKLEVIDLYQNSLSQLTSGVFQHLKNLERLFLGMNKLVNLPEDIFKDLSSLVYLDLSNNSLTTLSIDLFAHMDYLMTIDLSGNRLISIGNVLHLPNIRLDLRWNNLHQLDNLTLEILTSNAEILFLKGNPWHCDCSLEPLRQWYQQLSISNEKDVKIDNPVCSYPSELANHTVNDLEVSLCIEIPASSTETSAETFTTNLGISESGHRGMIRDFTFQNVTRRAEKLRTDDKLPLAVIIGLVVAFLVVTFIIMLIFILIRKFRKPNNPANPDNKAFDSGTDECSSQVHDSPMVTVNVRMSDRKLLQGFPFRNNFAKIVIFMTINIKKMEVQSLNKFLQILIILFMCRITETQRSSPCHRKCSYVEAFQQANCEYRSLENIPLECNAASYLSLRYNHITRIRPEIFRGFPFLKYLLLSNNNISHIEANTFIGAPQLKSIKLLYNNLQVFDRYALNGTENRLRNIYLSRNSLRVIENGTFQLVPKLEVIDLYQNSLSQLTSGVFHNLKNLERLFLGMNKLVNLPEDVFKDLSSLVYLDLSNNSLTTLYINVFAHMDYLMTIDLSGNRLISIGNVLHLPNIRLDLRWNNLHQIDNLTLEILTSNVEILFLEGNPWLCDCRMEPLRQWYQQLSINNEKDVKIDNPVCSYPSELANHTVNDLEVSLCIEIPASSTETSAETFTTNLGISESGHRGMIRDFTFQNVTRRAEKLRTDDKLIIGLVLAVLVVTLIMLIVILIRKFCMFQEEKPNNPANPGNKAFDSGTDQCSSQVQNSPMVIIVNELKDSPVDSLRTTNEKTPLKRSSDCPGDKELTPRKDIITQEEKKKFKKKLVFA
ncbi:SLIT and NTRK-like protein 5 [Lytechinus variegatus]|uniref:SLIT and NTRK-like protein 5 n=1 Tax=Lytechinus variegatus TaxID=7654 RepID=UPI001BB0E6FE|nr:SLIT and NTRK-like protein 5 [Lytechinus variegatus]